MLLFAIAIATTLSQDAGNEVACWSSRRNAPDVSRTLLDGVVVTMTHNRDAGAVEDACKVEVRDRTATVVFSKTGFNTRLHPGSGLDIDNDRQPDLVVGVDEGGGNRCCWEYSIVSFHPTARVLATFDNPAFDRDGEGRTVVWTVAPFYDLGLPMAQSPTILIADQFRSGRQVGITHEYCAALLAGRLIGPANLADKLALLTPARMAASRTARGKPSFDIEQTRVAAASIAMQMLYCGREDDARASIARVWPDQDQDTVRTALSVAVAAVRRR